MVFYHLLDFSKKRTWVIVIDLQLIENTNVVFLSPPFFFIYSTTFNFLLIDCAFPFQLSERFLTYTTLVNGSTYIRTAQSAPVHLNDIGEMVGVFSPLCFGIAFFFLKDFFWPHKIRSQLCKKQPTVITASLHNACAFLNVVPISSRLSKIQWVGPLICIIKGKGVVCKSFLSIFILCSLEPEDLK